MRESERIEAWIGHHGAVSTLYVVGSRVSDSEKPCTTLDPQEEAVGALLLPEALATRVQHAIQAPLALWVPA